MHALTALIIAGLVGCAAFTATPIAMKRLATRLGPKPTSTRAFLAIVFGALALCLAFLGLLYVAGIHGPIAVLTLLPLALASPILHVIVERNQMATPPASGWVECPASGFGLP